MSERIEDYALISNCHSAALVSKKGSIDWLCLPRFDSPSCFSALLGTSEHGCWSIAPTDHYQSTHRYVDGTVVLETEFKTASGLCRLTDCMVIDAEKPTLIRVITGVEGEVGLSLDLALRFDYGSIVPSLQIRNGETKSIRAEAGPEAVVVGFPVPFEEKDSRIFSTFKVKAGERLSFTLMWYRPGETEPLPIRSPGLSVRKTIYWWREWSDRSDYRNIDAPGVIRSLLTLKALTYEPSGGIVAAPTTSLPESIGKDRNWDYRYGWIRDSTFTVHALLSAGYREEASHWNEWLLRAIAGTPSEVNIMYGVTGERRLTEIELNWLPGYENSKPVRVGNGAYKQVQFDVFGELLDTMDLARRTGLKLGQDTWRTETEMLKHLCKTWSEPDNGIWEIREKKRHYTHSKLMAWVAIDRGIKAIQEFGQNGPLSEWTALRDKIHRDVCENGFDEKLGSFVQSYGSKELDASLLMMGLVGFLPPTDPRLSGTVDAIQKNLTRDGLIMRYRASSGVDGIGSEEGSFLPCTFWLVDNLVLLERKGEAEELFQALLQFRNDVGLFSEEYGTRDRRMLGNFPQAFSHIAHINSAFHLAGGKQLNGEVRPLAPLN
jgi:GH15 family glucan-1,4-alpha-glucosidase